MLHRFVQHEARTNWNTRHRSQDLQFTHATRLTRPDTFEQALWKATNGRATHERAAAGQPATSKELYLCKTPCTSSNMDKCNMATNWLLSSMHGKLLSLNGIQRKALELGNDRVVDGGRVVSFDGGDGGIAEERVLAT
jgi:hypothetical protein